MQIRKQKIQQTFIRALKHDSYVKLISGKWYPAMKGFGLCYKVIDESDNIYLVDNDAAESCSNWEIKTVEVEL